MATVKLDAHDACAFLRRVQDDISDNIDGLSTGPKDGPLGDAVPVLQAAKQIDAAIGPALTGETTSVSIDVPDVTPLMRYLKKAIGHIDGFADDGVGDLLGGPGDPESQDRWQGYAAEAVGMVDEANTERLPLVRVLAVLSVCRAAEIALDPEGSSPVDWKAAGRARERAFLGVTEDAA